MAVCNRPPPKLRHSGHRNPNTQPKRSSYKCCTLHGVLAAQCLVLILKNWQLPWVGAPRGMSHPSYRICTTTASLRRRACQQRQQIEQRRTRAPHHVAPHACSKSCSCPCGPQQQRMGTSGKSAVIRHSGGDLYATLAVTHCTLTSTYRPIVCKYGTRTVA